MTDLVYNYLDRIIANAQAWSNLKCYAISEAIHSVAPPTGPHKNFRTRGKEPKTTV